MDRICGMYERLEDCGTQGTDKETEDVGYNDYGCGELDLQTLPHADDEGEGHGKNRKEQLVIDSCRPAAQGHDGMKQGEYMYDPA